MVDEYEYGVLVDTIMTEETQEIEDKTSRPVSLSTKNPTRADLILNLACHGDRSKSNSTSHDINNGQIVLENLTVVQVVKN
jgi:hypothetical protein